VGNRDGVVLYGYDAIQKRPTGIYKYLRTCKEPLHIYAAGLRPLGLYGDRLQHTVFYDLHSSALPAENFGVTRLNLVRIRFHPDLIVVATDPHVYSSDMQIPMAAWLRRQPCLHEVYSDDVSVAFTVDPQCTSEWEGAGSVPSGAKLLMGHEQSPVGFFHPIHPIGQARARPPGGVRPGSMKALPAWGACKTHA